MKMRSNTARADAQELQEMSGMKEILAVLGVTAERPGGDFVNFPPISDEQFEKEIKEFFVKHFGNPNEDEISINPSA